MGHLDPLISEPSLSSFFINISLNFSLYSFFLNISLNFFIHTRWRLIAPTKKIRDSSIPFRVFGRIHSIDNLNAIGMVFIMLASYVTTKKRVPIIYLSLAPWRRDFESAFYRPLEGRGLA